MTRIAGLDGIRAIAVILIITSHFYEGSPFIRSLSLGHWGVMVFFVLSGFLVSRILLAKRTQSKKQTFINFFARRALRIFPLYYLSIAVFSFIGSGWGGELVYHLSYTSNFYILHHSQFLAPHFWSLSVEEQFYLILPFLILFSGGKNMNRLCLILFLSDVFFRVYYCIHQSGTYDRLLWSNTDALGLGIMIALLEGKRLSAIPMFVVAISPILISFILGSTFLGIHYCILLLTGLILYHLYSTPQSISLVLLENRVIKYIGTISYGLYVWHYLLWQNIAIMLPFELMLVQLHPIMEFGHGNVLIAVTLTAVIAVCSYEFFEKPLLKLKSRFA